MKVCSSCKELKTLDKFYPRKEGKDGLRGQCLTCESAAAKRRYQADRPRHIAWATKKNFFVKYGLTIEDVQNMKIVQDYKCAICGEKENGKSLSVDHCHTTGKVRALLCTNCNVGLGMFKDNINTINSAIKYLERN